MKNDTAESLLAILEYSVMVGKEDATKGPRMLDAVFFNLEKRCADLRAVLFQAKRAE